MKKILLVISLFLVGCSDLSKDSFVSYEQPFPILKSVHVRGYDLEQTKKVLEEFNYNIIDGGKLYGPELDVQFSTKNPIKPISYVSFGFNYDQHLFTILYVYEYKYNSKNINKELMNEVILNKLNDIFGSPDFETPMLWARENKYSKLSHWKVNNSDLNFGGIIYSKDTVSVSLEYSWWPKGDKLRQFAEQEEWIKKHGILK